jgi:hypothetical protein
MAVGPLEKEEVKTMIGLSLVPSLAPVLMLLGDVAECIAAPYQPATPTPSEMEELPVFHQLSYPEQYAAARQLSREKQLRWIALFRDYDPAFPYYTNPGFQLNSRRFSRWTIGRLRAG